MKTAVSIPDDLFRLAEAAARRLRFRGANSLPPRFRSSSTGGKPASSPNGWTRCILAGRRRWIRRCISPSSSRSTKTSG